jgi:16S rRNA (guanine1207-N2)-methyltransferase
LARRNGDRLSSAAGVAAGRLPALVHLAKELGADLGIADALLQGPLRFPHDGWASIVHDPPVNHDRDTAPVTIRIGGDAERPRLEAFLGGRLQVVSPRGVRGPDRALLDALDARVEGRVLVAGSRAGLAAIAAARLRPEAEVEVFHMDAYESLRAREAILQNGAARVRPRIAADLPMDGGFDWVLLAAPKAGDAMVTAELVREAHAALKPRGKVLAATDNARDRWLHDRILEAFGAATIHLRSKHGTAYIARKEPGREPRPRDPSRRFTARLLGLTLDLETRPGVFSHGEADQGTLALAEAAPIGEASRVLDLGCGSGALGIAAAIKAPRGFTLLVDSNARSTRVARGNLRRNGAEGNALVLLACDLSAVRNGVFDLALANPPYYSDHRITLLFTRDAHRTLVPGGELLLVSKSPERPLEIAREAFGEARVEERRGYAVIRAAKAAVTPAPGTSTGASPRCSSKGPARRG